MEASRSRTEAPPGVSMTVSACQINTYNHRRYSRPPSGRCGQDGGARSSESAQDNPLLTRLRASRRGHSRREPSPVSPGGDRSVTIPSGRLCQLRRRRAGARPAIVARIAEPGAGTVSWSWLPSLASPMTPERIPLLARVLNSGLAARPSTRVASTWNARAHVTPDRDPHVRIVNQQARPTARTLRNTGVQPGRHVNRRCVGLAG
jgi:hypothetical protein